MANDLSIEDQEQFLKQVPTLILHLKLRMMHDAWNLNYSVVSLTIRDKAIQSELDRLIAANLDITNNIDGEFLKEITAYVGEVICRQARGQWQVNNEPVSDGPYVVFPTSHSTSGYKWLDLHSHMIRNVIEGESISRWYEYEVSNED